MRIKILLGLSILQLMAAPLFAQDLNAPAANAAPQNMPNVLTMPLPDYLSSKPVVLDSGEKAALQLADEWARAAATPFRDERGRLIYVHGASVPTIIGAPFQVCDVELQPGEVLREVIIGDSARWLVDAAKSGSTRGDITHIMIKPIDSGLQTSAVITTNRRVYHLKLISQREGHTPYIGFAYQEDFIQQYNEQTGKEERVKAWASMEHEGQPFDLSKLNFAYFIDGSASWKPTQVYDTGSHTYIKLPDATQYSEAPVLLVRKNDNDVLVNYRVKGATMVVDGVFEHLILVLGVGYEQEKINILREGN